MTNLISDADLVHLQALAPALVLSDTYQVLRQTVTSDSMGGTSRSWALASSGFCSISAGGATVEALQAGSFQSRVGYTVTLPLAADVTAADRLKVNGSRTLDVVGVDQPSVLSLFKHAVCFELDPGVAGS